jgi:hypothetical protein
MALQKKKPKNGMVFHMTKNKNPIKNLEKLANDVIKVIHLFNDLKIKDLNLGQKRFALLNQLSNVLPVINELINHIELEDTTDVPNIGMTTED